MPSTNVTVKLGSIEFNCTVDWTVCPGEDEVRYDRDGSGYPGSPATVDCIDNVECNECEWPERRPDHYYSDDQPEDWGDTTDWGYSDLSDRPGAKAIAERWIFAELSDGSYDDELFADADWPEDYDYDE